MMKLVSMFMFASLLVTSSSFGTFLLEVKGKVLSIENGQAVVKADNEEKTQLILKRLSKENRRTVMNANGSDKIITIKISPETLRK